MAKVILKLRKNPQTGSQDLFIDYESDGDALPFEHEKDHKDLVKKILSDKGIPIEELGGVYIDRDSIPITEEESCQEETPQKECEKTS